MRVQLNNPICTQINEKVAFSRRISNKWRLIGWGTIIIGITLKIGD
jgi:translation initiation factor 2 subunit 3